MAFRNGKGDGSSCSAPMREGHDLISSVQFSPKGGSGVSPARQRRQMCRPRGTQVIQETPTHGSANAPPWAKFAAALATRRGQNQPTTQAWLRARSMPLPDPAEGDQDRFSPMSQTRRDMGHPTVQRSFWVVKKSAMGRPLVAQPRLDVGRPSPWAISRRMSPSS